MVSEPSKNNEEGWPATAKPATHGQADCKGQPAVAKARCKGATGHFQNLLARAAASRRGRPWAWLAPAGAAPTGVGSARGQAAGGGCSLQGRRWRLLAARSQGVAPWLGLPPARATAGRSDRQQWQRPRKAAPPTHEVPPEGSSACRRDGCPRRWRAAPWLAQGQRRRHRWRRVGQGEG
ncbi:hypothetical protein GW17_00006712 [Ensete ventricosum]|nr:hypothetical protein GW17_00006712 [Ensete ventricosum]